MRQAFDWLRDTVAPRYEAEAKKLFESPWETRDAYIDVVLDRSRENVVRFMTAAGQAGAFADRNRDRAEAARTAALPDADVHQLRLVLRRTLRNRNGPGDSVRRPRPATGGTIVHRGPGHALSRPAGAGPQQSFRNRATAGPFTSATCSPRWWIWKRSALTTRSALCSRNTGRTPASIATTWNGWNTEPRARENCGWCWDRPASPQKSRGSRTSSLSACCISPTTA